MPNPASAEEALVSRLLGGGDLVARIGNRLWPDISNDHPQLPFLLYGRTAAARIGTLTGSTGLRRAEFVIDVFAVTASDQQAVGAVVETLLDNWRDQSIGVQGCFVEPGDSEETEWGRTLSLNVVLWFQPVA